jgi:hypothetical protein
MSDEVQKTSTSLVLRSANRVSDTTFTRIWKFYYERTEIELKEKEEEIRQRLEHMWMLLGNILSDRQAVTAHVKWCEKTGRKCKERMAYEDLHYAKMLFGDPKKQSKSALRAVVSEWLIKGIKYAWDQKDLDNYQRLIRRFNNLNGLEGDQSVDSSRPAVVINFSADPEVLKKQIDELRKRAQAANAVDTDYQEVK